MEHICSRKKQTEVGNFFRDGILVNQSREQSSERITSLTTLVNRLIELILLTCSLLSFSFFFFFPPSGTSSISLFDNILFFIIDVIARIFIQLWVSRLFASVDFKYILIYVLNILFLYSIFNRSDIVKYIFQEIFR